MIVQLEGLRLVIEVQTARREKCKIQTNENCSDSVFVVKVVESAKAYQTY